jgi:regulatory protein YycH of two-component signal transduction system YycFG
MERIKNIILAALVLLSLLLSWQLMTYHPQYDYLNQGHYDQLEGLAESKDWRELFKPHLVVYHLAEGEIRVAPPNTYVYNLIYEKMNGWELELVKAVDSERKEEWQALLEQAEGIEFLFWHGLPLEVITSLFKGDNEKSGLSESELERAWIRRMLLYQDPHFQNEVSLLFIQEEGSLLESRITNLSLRELNALIEYGKEQYPYQAIYGDDAKTVFAPVHYVSKEPVMMAEVHYHYKRIPIHHMLTYLFVDPSLARRIEQKGNTILYIHGPRGLQVDQDYTTMHYFHPQVDQLQNGTLFNLVQSDRAVQFVNQHKGWDKDYLFDQLHVIKSEFLVQFQFREYLDTYPVYSEQGVHLSRLNIDLKPDRVVGYSRSLLQRGEMISQKTRKLPSGTALWAKLEESGVDLSRIQLVRPGYKLVLDETVMKYIPCWVIDFDNDQRWFITDLKQIGGDAA